MALAGQTIGAGTLAVAAVAKAEAAAPSAPAGDLTHMGANVAVAVAVGAATSAIG